MAQGTKKKTQQAAEKPPKTSDKEIKVQQAKLADLIPDDKNFNKGTQFGQHLIEKSLRENGAGRSILLDKNNRIIAGNKTTENAAAIDMNDVIIVETDGTKLVAVKRTDIDLDSERGRKMALADNATSAENLEWDEEQLKAMSEEMDAFDAEEWGVEFEGEEDALISGELKRGAIGRSLGWGSKRIPITEDEFSGFEEIYSQYLDKNGISVGFAFEIIRRWKELN